MDFPHSTILLILTFLIFSLPSSKPVSDYNTLVYKTCATQTFNDDQFFQSYSQTLTSMFQQLIAQSSQSKFFKTQELINDDTSISGLFQCRKDITTQDCFTCVNSLPHMSNTLCSNSISALVQLDGCYVKYEPEKVLGTSNEELSDQSNSKLLHYKDCGVISSVANYVEFRELMEEAFVALENGIVNSDGYYRVNYKGVQLMAQCEGDSETCECSQCVYAAVEVAKEQCGTSLSAQIYLDKCFISYTYLLDSYGNGNGNSNSGTTRNNSTEKLAAIIVGGVAAAFLGLLFLSFLISRWKKDDYE